MKTELKAKRLLRVREAADILGLAVGTVYNKTSRGDIPCVKIGGALRFDIEDLLKLIEVSKRQVAMHRDNRASTGWPLERSLTQQPTMGAAHQ